MSESDATAHLGEIHQVLVGLGAVAIPRDLGDGARHVRQQVEAEFLDLLRERQTRARVLIWSLLEFLERPADPMQEIVDSLSGAETHLITDLPATKPMRGLPEFLQALRNAGMNPHLAGETTHGPQQPNGSGHSQRPSV